MQNLVCFRNDLGRYGIVLAQEQNFGVDSDSRVQCYGVGTRMLRRLRIRSNPANLRLKTDTPIVLKQQPYP